MEVYNSSAYIVNEAEFEGMEAYGRKYLMASGIFAKKNFKVGLIKEVFVLISRYRCEEEKYYIFPRYLTK